MITYCKECVWYKPAKTDDDGSCHRYPPQSDYNFPKTNADQYCSEAVEIPVKVAE